MEEKQHKEYCSGQIHQRWWGKWRTLTLFRGEPHKISLKMMSKKSLRIPALSKLSKELLECKRKHYKNQVLCKVFAQLKNYSDSKGYTGSVFDIVFKMKTEYRSTVWSGKKRFQLFAICFILICHWGEKTDRRTKKRKSDWHDQHLNERNLWFFLSIVWKHWLWNKMCLHLCWENCIRHSSNLKHSSILEISHIWMWKIEETFHDGEH